MLPTRASLFGCTPQRLQFRATGADDELADTLSIGVAIGVHGGEALVVGRDPSAPLPHRPSAAGADLGHLPIVAVPPELKTGWCQ
jgi:hypothetical protein